MSLYQAREDASVPGCLVLQFSDRDKMNSFLDPISDIVDGKLAIPRQGHNFPIEFVTKEHALHKIRKEGKIKYIVGYTNGDLKTFQHEICHAKYYLDTIYKKDMDELFHSFDEKTQESICAFLTKLGYQETVHLDEFQAYYNTEKPSFFGIKDTSSSGKKGKKRGG